MLKTWNPRDQPQNELKTRLEHNYKQIEREYNLLKKVSSINDAKKIINEIWTMKDVCADIERELMRRAYNDTSI